MARVYSGFIPIYDDVTQANKYIKACYGDDVKPLIKGLHRYTFTATGTVGDSLTYCLCNDAGDILPEYSEIQFIRAKNYITREFVFLVNSVN